MQAEAYKSGISRSNFQKVDQLANELEPGSGVVTRLQVMPKWGSVSSEFDAQITPGREIALQT